MIRKLIVTILIFLILIGSISNIVTSIFDTKSFEYNEPQLQLKSQISLGQNVNEISKPFKISETSFCKNNGQLENNEVKFYSQGGAVWFTDDGVWFEVRDKSSIISQQSKVYCPEFGLTTDDYQQETNGYKRVIIKQEFNGANKVQPIGRDRLSWNSNFFFGNDSSKWQSNVPNYREIYYRNIYDGIDLKYYSKNNNLKYDFIVHPGAKIESIRLKYIGAEKIEIYRSCNTIIHTEFGKISDNALFMYQDYFNYKNTVNGRFKNLGDYEVGYEILGEYCSEKDLIIDPTIKLGYSTFVGGINEDSMLTHSSIDSDANGSTIIAGRTTSYNFPTTPGVYNTSYNNNYDIIAFKLDRNGSNLLFSTYVGGKDFDGNFGLSTDRNDNVFVTGITKSSDFPTTNGSFDTDLNNQDSFVFKLSTNGSALLYSTFLGGSDQESWCRIKVDAIGYAYVCGVTGSSNFPVTSGAFDTSYNGGDCFVTKLNINGSELLYSTFIGGSGAETCYGMDIDTNGSVFITGYTDSIDYPIKGIPYDDTFNGVTDIFVTKFNQNGSDLMFSTYIGGSSNDGGTGIVVDKDGYITLTGVTYSTDFPITNGSFDNIFNGTIDSFILQLDPNGYSLIFSTYIGGAGFDYSYDITLDYNGNSYITGYTYSNDFPTTPNALNDTINLKPDTFLFVLDSNGSKMIYSTYIGGMGVDIGAGINIDRKGNVIISGNTGSPDFPTTLYAYDRTYNGGVCDFFVLNLTFFQYMEITSVSLLANDSHTTNVFSRCCPYTFRVNITNTESLSDLKFVRLNLDPGRTNIQLLWDRTTGKFSKILDPYNYIFIDQSSSFYNDSWTKWTIDFNLIFNWTFPHEEPNHVQVFAKSLFLQNQWFNISNLFNVENDLVFRGKLKVFGSDNLTISKNGLVQGGEHLKWTGLTVVYENTTDIFPPADEFDITIWDEDGNHWIDSPEPGQSMNITTFTPNKTTGSFNYTINLTCIPPECDKTNQKFTIRIDADNVTFSNPWPDKDTWLKSSEVYTGVTITDYGGGVVDNTSIMHSISEDNGTTWTDWNSTEFAGISESITVHDFITFEDGNDNFIKWRAKDSLGNGPVESEPHRILVDTRSVFFSNPTPLPTHESLSGEVEVGITISDKTSGVNASNIKYSTSTDAGNYWSSWKTVEGHSNGKIVNVKLNLIIPNGTDNRIRWRANDIAGNGPTYSGEYVINVNIPKPPVTPEVKLISPLNNSIITTTLVELTWEVIKNYNPNIVFDIKLGTQNPPQNIIVLDYTDTKLIIDDLKNEQTYYWTVIPKLNNINGTCISGIWSFTIEISLPKAILKTPINNSEITSTLPTLVWSVEYEGSETVTYDVYFGTNKDLPLKQENLTTTYFAIDTALQDNTTYYWKIVPWIGKYEGFSSEIWSFTMELKGNEIPEFGLALTLNPNPLEIKTGEVKFVSAIVTNLGEQKDNFTVTISEINNSKLTVENYRQDTLEIEPGKNKEFLIMISIKDGTEPGFENITVTTKSILAEKYNLNVQDSNVLTIKILEEDGQKGKDRAQPISIFYFSILLLIIILIIISIIIVILVRKKSSKKDSELVETQDIQPETFPVSITTPEPETTLEPLPGITQQQDETLEE